MLMLLQVSNVDIRTDFVHYICSCSKVVRKWQQQKKLNAESLLNQASSMQTF